MPRKLSIPSLLAGVELNFNKFEKGPKKRPAHKKAVLLMTKGVKVSVNKAPQPKTQLERAFRALGILIMRGWEPREALKRAKIPKELLMDAEIKARVDELIGNWGGLDATQRKKLYEAVSTKLLVESAQSSDPKERKLALDALKELREDPALGFKQAALPAAPQNEQPSALGLIAVEMFQELPAGWGGVGGNQAALPAPQVIEASKVEFIDEPKGGTGE